MCNPSSQCKHIIYRYTAAGTACSGNDGGVPGCLLWGQYYIIIYLRVSKRQTKGMPKTSFTFGNFHFTLFIARRACVYVLLLLYTYNNADDSARTHICVPSPESKCVAFRRTRPRRNHHHRRSTPPPSPVSAKYYIYYHFVNRSPPTFSYLYNIT